MPYFFKDSMYTLTYKGEKGLHVQEKETLEDLLSEFAYLLTNPSYIAQQGISLIKKEKRCVDFRVHTNKDGNNQWVLTALAAKAAPTASLHILITAEKLKLQPKYSPTLLTKEVEIS